MRRNDNSVTACCCLFKTMQSRPKSNVNEPRAVRDTLNLRIRPELRSLIDQAAELTIFQGSSLT